MGKLAQLLRPQRVAKIPDDLAQPIAHKQGAGMKFGYGNGDRPLSGYTIKRGVGVGGFGEVYFATNDAGKEVALKRIQRNLEVEMRGVRQCLNLKHPNLIGLYDIRFDEEGQGWIVMEFVHGLGLREAIDQSPSGMPHAEALRWFGQIAAGVAHLHDNGIVHRDLKPANIFEDGGLVKIGDYGLSKFISCSRRGGQTESVGTFHYMAPEIGKGEYGKEIDIYALGIILYEILTGNVPFDGETSQEIILKHLTADPDVTQLPQPFRDVIAKAMQKNPVARFRDVREMLAPLGLGIDDSGLVVQREAVASDGRPAPEIRPISSRPVTGTTPPPGATSNKPGRGSVDPTTYQPRYATIQQTSLAYEEPVARAVKQAFHRANAWINGLPNNGSRAAVLAIAVILLTVKGAILLPLLVGAITLYIPYYFIWWIMRPTLPPSSRPASGMYTARNMQPLGHAPVLRPIEHVAGGVAPGVPNGQGASPVGGTIPLGVPQQLASAPAPVKTIAPAKPKLTAKQIRVGIRRQLAMQPVSHRVQQVTGSYFGSTIVLGILATFAVIFGIGMGYEHNSYGAGLAWAMAMATAGSWLVLTLGKLWEVREGENAVRRFVQLSSGLALGAGAFALSKFLMVPWPEIVNGDMSEMSIEHWQGFYGENGSPILPAFVAHFALLLGLVRWWRQADPLRWTRLNLISIAGTLIAEMIANAIVPFPQPWGLFMAGGMSIAIQLSAPWRDPSESPVLAEASQAELV